MSLHTSTIYDKEPIDPTKPAKVEEEIKRRGKHARILWKLTKYPVKLEYVSKFVQEALQGGELDKRQLMVMDMIADTLVNRLELSRWDAGDARRRQERALREVDEELGTILSSRDLFIRAEAQGLSYMLVWPEDFKKLGLINMQPGEAMVEYPARGTSYWPEWGARLSENDKQLDIFFRDRSVRYTRKGNAPGVEGGEGSSWQLEYDQRYRRGWPEMVPIVPFACESMREPVSGIIRAVGPQLAINHVVSIDASTTEFAGFPTQYAVMKPKETELNELDIGRLAQMGQQFLDAQDDTPRRGAMATTDEDDDAIDGSPGSFLRIMADLVGEFKAAPTEATIGRIEFYAKAALVLCDMPVSVWAGTTANNSGELMRRDVQSLVSKAKRRIQNYTYSYIRMWELLIAQADSLGRGYTINLPERIVPVWDDPAQPDELYQIELVERKVEMGIPMRIALEQAGMNPDTIERINPEQVDANRERMMRRGQEGRRQGRSGPGRPERRGRRSEGDGAS